MLNIKPIQPTPVLKGKDAKKILNQTNMIPTQQAMNKNKMLHSVLTNIRKV